MTAPDPFALTRSRLRWRRWAGRALFECALIVVSVLVALAVANWAEERRTAARVAEARAYFVGEIRSNREILADPAYIPHHERLRGIFAQTAEIGNPTLDQAMPAFRALFQTGIHVAPLRDAVWRSASSSDLLAEMPLTEVFLLSDIYQMQDQLQRLHEGFVQGSPAMLAGMEAGRGVRAGITSTQLHLGDVVASEQALLEKYDQALAELDPQGRVPAARGPGDAAPPKG